MLIICTTGRNIQNPGLYYKVQRCASYRVVQEIKFINDDRESQIDMNSDTKRIHSKGNICMPQRFSWGICEKRLVQIWTKNFRHPDGILLKKSLDLDHQQAPQKWWAWSDQKMFYFDSYCICERIIFCKKKSADHKRDLKLPVCNMLI